MSVFFNRENAWENADCGAFTARTNRTFTDGSIASFEGTSGGVLRLVGRGLGGRASTGLEHLAVQGLWRIDCGRVEGKDFDLSERLNECMWIVDLNKRSVFWRKGLGSIEVEEGWSCSFRY